MAWPTWRCVWSAICTRRPATVVGRPLLPTFLDSSNWSALKVRIRAELVSTAKSSSVKSTFPAAPASSSELRAAVCASVSCPPSAYVNNRSRLRGCDEGEMRWAQFPRGAHVAHRLSTRRTRAASLPWLVPGHAGRPFVRGQYRSACRATTVRGACYRPSDHHLP